MEDGEGRREEGEWRLRGSGGRVGKNREGGRGKNERRKEERKGVEEKEEKREERRGKPRNKA